MKAIINKSFGLVTGCVFACCFSVLTQKSSAIEGPQLTVQSTNVVLSWPSTNTETYIIQYRPTLTAESSWATLEDFYPAASETNTTIFVHSNSVQYPLVSQSSGSGGDITPSSLESASETSPTSEMMAVPANGFGSAVPLFLYPAGFDLSGFTIFDSLTGESVSGSGYVISPSLMAGAESGGIQPMDAGSGDTNQYTGFYRVVRDGVHIFGLTNGAVLSGVVQFPIEFALGSTDEISGVVFYDENNSPIIGATADGSGNYWTLTWDTAQSFNGNYNVYAEIDFASDSPAVSVPVSVTVSNVISFPNYFSQIYGNQMWVYAETIPYAAYQLDIYDENTNYLGTFYDYADSGGYISFLWDLTDGNGYTFESTNFFGIFTVDTSSLSSVVQNTSTSRQVSQTSFQTASIPQKSFGRKIQSKGASPNADASSSSAKQTWSKEPTWSVGNSWAIAYSPLNPNDSVSTLRISEMMVGGDGGEYGGVVSTLGFYGLGAPMSPGNVSQSSAFQMADANSRTQFLGYMAQSQYRHLYFFGHGSPSAFGTTGSVIRYRDIQNTLGNFMHTTKPALYHPYRLVFIDGCSAGSGNLCEAFGIPATTVNTNYFATLGVESRAFLGFKTTTSFNPNQWTWRALMLGGFFNDWMNPNNTLQTCVNNAVNGVNEQTVLMDTSVKIYGATDLTKNTHTGR